MFYILLFRNLLEQATYLCMFFLLALVLASYFNLDIGWIVLLFSRIVRLGRAPKVKAKATVI